MHRFYLCRCCALLGRSARFLKESLAWPIFCSMQPSITIKITPAAHQLLRFVAAMRRKTHYKVLEHLLEAEAQRLLKRKE
jgi:hypothetical protein